MTRSGLADDSLLSRVPVREGYKILGGVVLYQKLGQGGMGAVYKGHQLRLDIDVAVKVMTAPPGVPPEQVENLAQRFLREARTAAAVRHQNLIRVYDVNSEREVHYLVMDYVDGESAADRLKRKGRLPEEEAVEICLGAAEGLAAAHEAGIVHRDVKPDNVLIDKKGNVVVADLGLAKVYSDEDGGGPSTLTETQQAVGTPYYMSPEQFASAKTVGPAADVWSLGVTLYQLLTGSLPWTASSVFLLASKVLTEPLTEPRHVRADLSDGVCTLIGRALEKAPEKRLANCGQMAEVLRRHLDTLRTSGGSVLPDEDAGSTKLALATATPPDMKTLTLIAEADVSPGSQKAPAPPGAEAKWFYVRGDRKQGPLTSKELQELAVRGEITPQTLIWKEGLADWIPASRTKGLFTTSSKFQSPPPLPGSKAPKGPPPLPGKPQGGETHGTEPAFSPADGASQGDRTGETPQRGGDGPEPAEQKAAELGEREEAHRPDERGVAPERRSGRTGRKRAARIAVPGRKRGLALLGVAAAVVVVGILTLAIAAGKASSRRQAERDRAARAAAAKDRLREEKRRRDGERRREEERREEERRQAEQARKAKTEQRRSQAEKAEATELWRSGTEARERGDLDAAIRDYDRAIQLNPSYAIFYTGRGTARCMEGDWDGAIRDCDRAIQLDPNDASPYVVRGWAKGVKGDWDGAIRDCDQAIRLDPSCAVAYNWRAHAKYSKGDLRGALLDFNKAIRLDPNFAKAYDNRAIVKTAMGDLDGAIRDCDQAIRLDPSFAVAYAGRGAAKARKRDWDEAIRDYDQAIRLDPNSTFAYVQRGLIKYIKDDLRGALLDLDTAIRLDTNSGEAYEARAKVKKAMGDRLGAERDAAKARDLGFTRGK